MSKIVEQIGLSTFDMQPISEDDNSEYKPPISISQARMGG